MRIIGFTLLTAGIILTIYALTMDVTVTIGRGGDLFGVANIERISQRLNFIILAGVLSVIGALFIGFSAVQPLREVSVEHGDDVAVTQPTLTDASGAVSVRICPHCKFMNEGSAESCARCDAQFAT